MGKKYIIELEDEPFHKENGDFLYRAKGFNSLVFDMTGIGKLTPYTEPDLEQVRKEAYEKGYGTGYEDGYNEPGKNQQEAYQRGLADAWEAARKIIRMPEVDLLNLFTECYSAVCTSLQVFLKYDASECIEKIRQYEQEKEEQIQVGDEVRNIEKGWIAVVSNIDGECMTLMDATGALGDGYHVNRFTKTGRHFPEIAAVLEKMRGEQDE